jgi:hypothetical protein
LGFQQIQGGQQITILGLRTFGERNVFGWAVILTAWSPTFAAESPKCTGDKAIAKMKEVFGGSFVRMGVGRVIEIGE